MMWRDWWRVNKSPILSILMDFCCLLVRSSSGFSRTDVLSSSVLIFPIMCLCFHFSARIFCCQFIYYSFTLCCFVLFIFRVLGLCFHFSCLLCLLLLLFIIYFKPSFGRGFIYCLFYSFKFSCSRPLFSLFLSVVLVVLLIIIYFKPSLGRGLGGSSYPLALTTRSDPNARPRT